jgi:hypothetical protein
MQLHYSAEFDGQKFLFYFGRKHFEEIVKIEKIEEIDCGRQCFFGRKLTRK